MQSPTFTPSPTPTVVPVQGDKLTNGGFESGLAGWAYQSWLASVVKVCGEELHGGVYGLCLKGKASGLTVTQDVQATANQRVELSGWVKTDPNSLSSNLVVELVARNQYGGSLRTFQLASYSGTTGGWLWVNGSAVMPGGTYQVRVQLRAPKLDGSIYLDDLSLR